MTPRAGAGMEEGGQASPRTISITVVYAPQPRQTHEVALNLPAGTTVAEGIKLAGLQTLFPDLPQEPGSVGVWGRKIPLDHPLQDQDRVEIWRPLTVDPKMARRERFNKQGARTAGLFSQRRPGAKPGY